MTERCLNISGIWDQSSQETEYWLIPGSTDYSLAAIGLFYHNETGQGNRNLGGGWKLGNVDGCAVCSDSPDGTRSDGPLDRRIDLVFIPGTDK
jgi:hypothetical protein